MDILHALILGTIEGATEFLPISSTGHLILASDLLGIPDSPFLSTFKIAVQAGAILAVVLLYWRMLLDWKLLQKLAVAFLPTALIGVTVYPYVKEYLLSNERVVVAALFFGGIALIVFELLYREPDNPVTTPQDITFTQALSLGLFQSVALIPGVSRSAATIIGGLALGIQRVAIVEFTFLLAVPTMLAATGYDLVQSSSVLTSDTLPLLLTGVAVSFVAAHAALATLRAYVSKYTFIPWGIYRIARAALLFLVVL